MGIEGEHSTRREEVQRAVVRSGKALISFICANRLISDVLSEFSSKLFATGSVGFSSNRPFRRYQICPKSIRWKGRYKRNKMQPYHDLALSVFSTSIFNEIIRSPFYRVFINVLGSRTSPLGPPGNLDRMLESIPP